MGYYFDKKLDLCFNSLMRQVRTLRRLKYETIPKPFFEQKFDFPFATYPICLLVRPGFLFVASNVSYKSHRDELFVELSQEAINQLYELRLDRDKGKYSIYIFNANMDFAFKGQLALSRIKITGIFIKLSGYCLLKHN